MVQDSNELHGIPMKIKVKLKSETADYPASNEISVCKNINENVGHSGFSSSPVQQPQFAAPAFLPQGQQFAQPQQPWAQPQQPQQFAPAPQPQQFAPAPQPQQFAPAQAPQPEWAQQIPQVQPASVAAQQPQQPQVMQHGGQPQQTPPAAVAQTPPWMQNPTGAPGTPGAPPW